MRIKKPLLIAFIGPVGSGKTNVANILAKRVKAVHINTDALRVTLRAQGKSVSRAISLARRLWKKNLVHGNSVIADFDAVLPNAEFLARK